MACRFPKTSLLSISPQSFPRQNGCLLKTIISLLPRCRLCSEAGENLDAGPNGNTGAEGKKLDLVVSCLRLDRVAASAFGIGRRKISNAIVAGHLYVNQTNTKKAALLLNEGDTVDYLRHRESDQIQLSRFKITAVSKDLTKKAKRRISVTRHGSLLVTKEKFKEEYTS